MVTRKRRVAYSKKLAKFICEEIEKGLTCSEICRKYTKRLPNYRSVVNWRHKYPEFSKDYDNAYRIYLQKLVDELDDLTKAEIPTVLDIMKKYPKMDTSMAKVQLNASIQQKRLRMDALKFMIAKVASRILPELGDKLQIEHSGGTIVQIMSYATAKIIKDDSEHPRALDGICEEIEENE